MASLALTTLVALTLAAGLTGCKDAPPAALCADVTCPAIDQCHAVGVCDPQTGACLNPAKMNDTVCNDGNGCTQTDSCQAGVCVGGSPLTCTASDQCHDVGACDPQTGACSNPARMNNTGCNDGNGCTQTDTCRAGTCVGASPRTCTASDQCHDVGACDPMTGNCSNPARMNNTGCNDGNGCTQADTCQAGTCVGASPRTCATAPDACHLDAGVCDPLLGSCQYPSVADGTLCDDGNPASLVDGCEAGVCVPHAASCRELQVISAVPLVSGIYTIYPPSGRIRTYCDMTTDGGGWTALFVGANGSPNVFDHFDVGAYLGTFNDPATGHYLQRGPSTLGGAAGEFAVACGGAMVKFPITEQVRTWLVEGRRQAWLSLTPTVVAGNVLIAPNTLWTGTNGDSSFVFSRNQLAMVSTFASSYAANNAYDFCNGVFDQASTARILYREPAPGPIRNVQAAAQPSCRAIVAAGGAAGDGLYWLTAAVGPAYLAYCDMTTDGGGWTTLFAGRNGSVNVFDHFDVGAYAGTCTDPATRCLRRGPAALGDSATEIKVSCGTAHVKFPMTVPVRQWLVDGTAQNWADLTPTLLAGPIASLPNTLYTGVGGDRSFVLARNRLDQGNTFAASYGTTTAYDACNGVADQAAIVRIAYREAAPTPIRNLPATARASCRALLAAGSVQDGLYWLVEPAGVPYLAQCDMTVDGGGWTTLFAGRNGSVNVFDHFDAGVYAGTCSDPATRCLRHGPPSLGDAAAEIRVSCGASRVKFPMTQPVQRWLVNGSAQNWTDVTPTLLAGPIPNLPNTLYTGVAGGPSFILARNRGALASTFASSFSADSAYDSCNGVADQASAVRIAYREVAPTPERNLEVDAASSCRAVLDAGHSLGDGLYWLVQAPGVPYRAYCDMSTDGGGWTALYAGRNGSTNVFSHFDDPAYAPICTDPATHCLVRAPATLGDSATDLLATCGASSVRFGLTTAARNWLAAGIRAGWIPLTPRVIAGFVANLPNMVFTGLANDSQSFIVARDQGGGANTFMASYSTATDFDSCAGVADQAAFARLSYREAAVTPIKNAPGQARTSCKAILDAGASNGNGQYWLSEPAGAPYLAYCDMTSDGGGWTAMFAGRNGQANVFGQLDGTGYVATCGDPATHCLRHAPATAGVAATELAVSCGGAMVRFPMTAAVRNFMVAGVQASWTPLVPTVVNGPVANLPNTLYTGVVAGGDSFIFARDQTGGASTFAASYPGNTTYDYCNGVADAIAPVRVYYR